jgi:tripartite-type tricarboxylate transporter receptor subunit TctC
VTDLAGNQVDLAVLPLSMVMQQVQAGKIRAYGVMGEAAAAMPAIPSRHGAGLEGRRCVCLAGDFRARGYRTRR